MPRSPRPRAAKQIAPLVPKKTKASKKKTSPKRPAPKKVAAKRATSKKKASPKRAKSPQKKASPKRAKNPQKKKASGRTFSSRMAAEVSSDQTLQGYTKFIYEGTTDLGNRSQKYWAIKKTGDTLCTAYGAGGRPPRFTCNQYDSAKAANAQMMKLIKQKTANGDGYVRLG